MTAILWALGGLVAGALVGSFVATLCLRWPEGRSVVSGRSHCDGCGRTLGGIDLLPLLPRRRARCCGAAIDPFHWRTEWAAALIGGAALALGGPVEGGALALFGWLLLALGLLDARHFWLPDRLVLLLALAGLPLGSTLTGEPIVTRLLTAAGAFLLLAAIGLAYRRLRGREGLGSGDPKLLAAIGLWLGPELTVGALLVAALLGLAEAIARRRAMDEARPLGTLLAIGAWAVAAAIVLRS